jgi:hypothetical protein
VAAGVGQEGDPMGANEQLVERFKSVVASGDMSDMGRLMIDDAADDFIQEWPQSGERIVGREGAMRLMEKYGEQTGTAPKLKIRRVIGEGDIYVAEGTIDYGDGIPVSYVGIAELGGGKVHKMTEYFANPFPAPDWRAPYVERFEPVPA